MDNTRRSQAAAPMTQRVARTRWISPGTGLIVGLVAAAIVVTRAARAEVERIQDALEELESGTAGFRSMWRANQRLRRLTEEVGGGS